MKENLLAAAAALFVSYPDANGYHFTSDEMAFQRETDAVSHGRSLGQKPEDIITVTRDEAEAWITKEKESQKKAVEKKSTALTKAEELEQTAFAALSATQSALDKAGDKAAKTAAEKELKKAKDAADAATAAVKKLAGK